MTTPPAQPPRDRLGRGVNTLIPQAGPASPTEQAVAALAALRIVPVQAGALHAAVALLQDLARSTGDEPTREAVAATIGLLRAAADQSD